LRLTLPTGTLASALEAAGEAPPQTSTVDPKKVIRALALRAVLALSLLGCLGALSPPPARAQARGPVLYEVRGQPRAQFGSHVFGLDDIDGDGAPEFAVSSPYFVRDGIEGSGLVEVRSGRTGAVLRSWFGDAETSLLGSLIGVVGDLNGDGLRDLAINHRRALFEVFSPATGESVVVIPRLFREGAGPFSTVGSLGDTDGDGRCDIFFANDGFSDEATWRFFLGRVVAFSGADGRVLWEVRGEVDLSRLGAAAAAVDDVTGDGIRDLVVGQPQGVLPEVDDPDAVSDPPAQLWLLSGADGSVVNVYEADERLLIFGGRSIVELGDTDQNGRPEVAVSAFETAYFGRRESGWVGVFDLPDFRLRYSFYGTDGANSFIAGSRLGLFLAAAGDADGDGTTDFIAGTDHTTGLDAIVRLFLYSGRSGGLLEAYDISHYGRDPYFTWLAPLGDVDGDGTPEFLVSDRNAGSATEGGVVHVVRYEEEKTAFFRGDANRDGRFNLSDAVQLLRVLFAGADLGPCLAALDSDANERLNLNDFVRLVGYLFFPNFPSPSPPFRECARYGFLNPNDFLGSHPLACDEFPSCP
jgi:hypothetical protein